MIAHKTHKEVRNPGFTRIPHLAKLEPIEESSRIPGEGTPVGLAASELVEFEALLRSRKNDLLGDVEGLEGANARNEEGSSGIPSHLAELATDHAEQDVRLGRMESTSHELQDIEEALARIRTGSYGLCEDCEERIPEERLRAIPYARLCIPCKTSEEEFTR